MLIFLFFITCYAGGVNQCYMWPIDTSVFFFIFRKYPIDSSDLGFIVNLEALADS